MNCTARQGVLEGGALVLGGGVVTRVTRSGHASGASPPTTQAERPPLVGLWCSDTDAAGRHGFAASRHTCVLCMLSAICFDIRGFDLFPHFLSVCVLRRLSIQHVCMPPSFFQQYVLCGMPPSFLRAAATLFFQ